MLQNSLLSTVRGSDFNIFYNKQSIFVAVNRMKHLKNAVSALITQKDTSFVIESGDGTGIKNHLYNVCWETLKGTLDLDACLTGLYDVVVR